MDESDVYVDVHKAIRRLTPAPRARRMQQAEAAAAAAAAASAAKQTDQPLLVDISEAPTIKVGSYDAHIDARAERPKTSIFMKRRGSAGPDGRLEGHPVSVKASLDEMRQQLRLGPANRANQPLSNTRNVFKVKQGLSGSQNLGAGGSRMPPRSVSAMPIESTPLLGGDGRNGGTREDGYLSDGAKPIGEQEEEED